MFNSPHNFEMTKKIKSLDICQITYMKQLCH